jgi:capsular exopolysaccharide synthesis family protein
MSRFYDLLTQADRMYGIPNAAPIPEEETQQHASYHHVTAASLAAETPIDALVAQAAPEAEALTRGSLTGKRIRAFLDPATRILPNVHDTGVVEYYRRLRTKLIQEQEANPFRSLMITSAKPQEGKSVTAMNLALSFAMLPSFSVLLIDGDLRRGSLSKWLRVDGEVPGFCNLLDGTATLDDVVLHCDELPLRFILHGRSDKSPAELLHSEKLGSHIGRLTEHFNLVIVDSSPVTAVADPQLIAGACDAVLVVTRAFYSTCKQLEKTVQELQRFRLLGAVLNAGTRVKRYGGYSAYY